MGSTSRRVFLIRRFRRQAGSTPRRLERGIVHQDLEVSAAGLSLVLRRERGFGTSGFSISAHIGDPAKSTGLQLKIYRVDLTSSAAGANSPMTSSLRSQGIRVRRSATRTRSRKCDVGTGLRKRERAAPAVCRAMESLIAEIVEVPVSESPICCDLRAGRHPEAAGITHSKH